jgi:pantoate--beta-alanine ligase
MILFKKNTDLVRHLETRRNAGILIGFVPTMGALHKGHISLIRNSKGITGLTVCSIFVNPTQFNDPKDFQKYPNTIEDDIFLLEKNGTDILFLPDIEEVYPKGTKQLEHYDLGNLENILEGQYRPGHFQGVCQVMSRLLNIVNPDLLFMGQKDYQQCKVVKKLLALTGSKIKFQICPTLRETDGLAMSSRNMLLNAEERKNAAGIYLALSGIIRKMRPGNLSPLLEIAKDLLLAHKFRIDYVETADAENLEILHEWDGKRQLVALAAAFQDGTRLIDNMSIEIEHNPN